MNFGFDIDFLSPTRVCPVFFIIDTSRSMFGGHMSAVDSAVNRILAMLSEINVKYVDREIKVAFLMFSRGAQWLTPHGLVEPENFRWDGLGPCTYTDSDMGEAFRMLDEAAHRGYKFTPLISFSPVVLLFSTGEPTDDYRYHLAKLWENMWFIGTAKLALGGGTNDHVLAEFTGTIDTVLRGTNAGKKMVELLKRSLQPRMVDYSECRENCSYCGVERLSFDIHYCFGMQIAEVVPDDNPLWQALQRIRNQLGENIFLGIDPDSLGKLKSALADVFAGKKKDTVRLRKRTVEAVELGVYARLKDADASDLERVVRVEIERLRDDGIDEVTAQEVVYALAKFFFRKREILRDQEINDEFDRKQQELNDACEIDKLPDFDAPFEF